MRPLSTSDGAAETERRGATVEDLMDALDDLFAETWLGAEELAECLPLTPSKGEKSQP